MTILVSGGWRRPEGEAGTGAAGFLRIALVVGWVVAFLTLLEVAGYVITGTLLLLVLMLALRVRWRLALVLSLAIVPLTYQVFAVGLRVPLPWGWLGW